MKRIVPLIATAMAITSMAGPRALVRAAEIPTFRFRVIQSYPHDDNAFTQGLIYRDGFLYESTGLNGRSSLRKVELETGRVLQQRAVQSDYFAEGLTDWGDQLVQLTWRSQLGFVYDLSTFSVRQTFALPGEGWGLAHDAELLIVSDGSSRLRFLDPTSFREVRHVEVTDNGAPVRDLNELEVVRGQIYANVWQSDRIAMIASAAGNVTGWIDLTGLMAVGYRLNAGAVLNGIAYDSAGDRLFVTGKLWPKLFEIQVLR
jgi:glutaminyl-peptide cyclotransferase